MLIVMGLFDAAARTDGLASGPTLCMEHGFVAGAATVVVLHSRIDLAGGGSAARDSGVGVVLHSRIDVAGGVAASSDSGVAAVLHSRIEVAGGVVSAGSPAASDSDVVTTSTGITRRASILVPNMARPSMRFI
jgi:hypothetical protein